MILVIGGAYQGKEKWTRTKFLVKDDEFFHARRVLDSFEVKYEDRLSVAKESIRNKKKVDDDISIEMTKHLIQELSDCLADNNYKVFTGLHHISKYVVKNEDVIDEQLLFESMKNLLQGYILIGEDISQGLVPMDVEERNWREANGRLLIKLAGVAKEVYRVFVGIGKRIDA